MEKDTGGLAFPLVGSMPEIQEAGMTLRDYFAAKAMQALLANAYAEATCEGDDRCMAHEAYMVADAMLKARNA